MNQISKKKTLTDYTDIEQFEVDVDTSLVEKTKNKETKNPIFWSVDKGKVQIYQSSLIDFLEVNGFRKFSLSKGKNNFVQIQNNIAKEVTPDFIQCFVRDSLRSWNMEELPKESKGKVIEKIHKGASNYFNSVQLVFLPEFDLDLDFDSLDDSKVYFENGFVVVNKHRFYFREYDYLEKPIWEHERISFSFDRSFEKNQNKELWKEGQFYKFVSLTQNKDPKRIENFMLGYGYLLYRYSQPEVTKAVVLTDGHGGVKSKDGRSGKTLTAKSLKWIRNQADINGKDWTSDKNFAWSKIEVGTNMVSINDISKKFDFERLYNVISDGFDIEKKGKDVFRLEGERKPKMILTSNLPLKIDETNGSDMARVFEIEFSNYFNLKQTPTKEFGGQFGLDDWSTKESHLFFLFCFECLKKYLAKMNLPEISSKGIANRRLATQTREDFVEFMDSFLTDQTLPLEIEAKQLKSDYGTACGHVEDWQISKWLTTPTIQKWTEIYCNQKGLDFKKVEKRNLPVLRIG